MIGVQTVYLKRNKDTTGTSGTGIVATGAVLASGKVVVEWITFTSSISIFNNLEHLREVHGHDGNTEIIVGPIPIDTKYTQVEVPPKRKYTKRKKADES